MPLLTFTFDGTVFDLTRVWIDVLGGRWEWTGLVNAAGEPLMQHLTDTPLPLPDVYATYGPLIPAAVAPSAEAVRSALLGAPVVMAKPHPEPEPTPEPEVPVVDDVLVSPGAWASAWRRCRTALRIPVGGAR